MAQGNVAKTTRDNDNFPALVTKSVKQIQHALPKHISPERMIRISITAWRNNPKLQKCKPLSVLACVIQAAQLGLEPDLLGRSYLVPYKDECQFIPGWRGLVDLCNRTGKATVWTSAVYEGDEFDYALGSKPYITHRPKGESDPKKLLYVYACGKVKDIDQEIIEVWPSNRVWTHRDKFNKVGKSHYSFLNEEMYARKVVLLQILKYLPASTELDMAMQLNNTAEVGTQNISVSDSINGTWSPVFNDNPNASQVQEPIYISPPTTTLQDNQQDKPQNKTQTNVKFTYANVAQMIIDSTCPDEVDLAIDVMDECTNDQKTTLTTMASSKMKEFGGNQ